MQLLQSWKESLAIFAPKNFKLFFLVTLKAILETFVALFRYCWAPLLLFLVGSFFSVEQLPFWLGSRGPLAVSALLWMSGFLFLLIFLAARPSVLRKSYWYFASYWYYWVYIAVGMLASFFLKIGLLLILELSLFFAPVWHEWLRGMVMVVGAVEVAFPLFFLTLLVVPGIVGSFFVLFLLDSDGTPKAAFFSVWRALKMFVYNFPAALFIWFFGLVMGFLVAWIPIVLITQVLSWIATLIWSSGTVSLMGVSRVVHTIVTGVQALGLLVSAVVVACFMTNFYIKRLHDQCGIYFETKEKE